MHSLGSQVLRTVFCLWNISRLDALIHGRTEWRMANLLLIVIGIGAGILAGFFGVGGGIIIIPALIFGLGYTQHMASGTSLVALLLPVGLLGVLEYYRAGKIGPENIKAGLI